MDKEFVPHEQSLELRKLEFSEPCLGFYVGKDKEVFISSNDFNAPYQFRLDSKTTFVAPTFSQAFRWFRKTHNLIGLVEGGYDNGKNIFTYNTNFEILDIASLQNENIVSTSVIKDIYRTDHLDSFYSINMDSSNVLLVD